MPEPMFANLNRLVREMKGDLYARFMRRAQKGALIEWRDRTTAPGVAARFRDENREFYRFSARARPRRGNPYYVASGDLRAMLLKRKPRSINAKGSGEVRTVLKYGGGALNFLVDKRGIVSTSRSTTIASVTVQAHSRHHRGTSFSVRSYRQRKRIDRKVRNHASLPYSSEFGNFLRDSPWIAKRTSALFVKILRRAAIDPRTGGIKSSVLQGVDDVR